MLTNKDKPQGIHSCVEEYFVTCNGIVAAEEAPAVQREHARIPQDGQCCLNVVPVGGVILGGMHVDGAAGMVFRQKHGHYHDGDSEPLRMCNDIFINSQDVIQTNVAVSNHEVKELLDKLYTKHMKQVFGDHQHQLYSSIQPCEHDTKEQKKQKEELIQIIINAEQQCLRKAKKDTEIEILHMYNDSKDITQFLLSQLCKNKNVTLKAQYEQYELPINEE